MWGHKFLDGLPDLTVWFMSVTSLLISLHDAMLSIDVKLLWECTVKFFDCQYCGEQRKTDQYLKFLHFLKYAILSEQSYCFFIFLFLK